jgi:ribosomal peptide maturation radical SAM protein 1
LKILFAVMPWHSLHAPSLGVSLLHNRIRDTRPADDVTEYYGGLRWADWLLRRSDGELRPVQYDHVASMGVHYGLGDWVFSGVLYGDEQWGQRRLREYAAKYSIDIGTIISMRRFAAEFIQVAADEILAADPAVVGFTSTFMQNVPSLALAQELKRRRGDLVVVFGGGNCDGPMGHALHRNHRFIDYVVRGEGEIAFPRLLDHIERAAAPDSIPAVCWWRGAESVANTEGHVPVPPAIIPAPNFDSWLQQFEASAASQYVEPRLVLEGSRGCWWGEKHQCTFCGLNGSIMTFRSQPAERFWSQVEHFAARHRILDFITADNIMELSYFQEVLPRMAASGWDLRFHFEVKANLRAEQVAQLAEAGVRGLQPGIESLSSRVLKIMDKGVTGAINVRLLRECEEQGISASWNYLYGFPGEEQGDYTKIIDQIPALSHLQPPVGVTEIVLNRFSPFFERPELGFGSRVPAEHYGFIYDLPDNELNDLVYAFDTEPRGISGTDAEKLLTAAVEQWVRCYGSSRLLMHDAGAGGLTVTDERELWPRRTHELTGWQADAYRELRQGRSAQALRQALAKLSHQVPPDRIRDWLDELVTSGMLFADDGTFVALATSAVPIKMFDRPDPYLVP